MGVAQQKHKDIQNLWNTNTFQIIGYYIGLISLDISQSYQLICRSWFYCNNSNINNVGVSKDIIDDVFFYSNFKEE